MSGSATSTIARDATWFGLFAALSSSVGQTFFIGLFGTELQAAHGLDDAGLGRLYATATLCSGLLMFWLGAIADRHALRQAITVALALLAGGALLMAAGTGQATLWLALFLLRLGGQGLAGHLAIVAAARYVSAVRRGRGIAIAALGFILGEALLPALAVLALTGLHWRGLWWLAAAVLLAVALPGLRRLARTLPAPALLAPDHGTQPIEPLLGRRRLLRDPAFLAALAVVLLSAFVVTAVFLHQRALADRQGWPLALIPVAFGVFALAQVLATLLAGRLVDRFSAHRLARTYLWPLALAVLVLTWIDGPPGLLLGFAALGLTAGAQGVVAGALWAEVFGIAQVGLVRGVYTAMMVLCTALSPWLLGLVLAAGMDLRYAAAGVALYAVAIPLLVGPLLDRRMAARPAPVVALAEDISP